MRNHESRRALVQILRERPGRTLTELANDLDVDYKTALHHARVLERAGHIVVAAEGRRRPCYLRRPSGERQEPPRVIFALRAVRAGASTPAALAAAAGVARGTAGSMLERLAASGLLARTDGIYRLTSAAREALAADQRFSEGGIMGERWSASESAS